MTRRHSRWSIVMSALTFLSFVALAAQAPPAKPAASTAAPARVVLPVAIDKAFKQAYPTAVVKHVSKEKEAGRVVYEVESVDAGKGRDLVYRPDGTVVEVEEEMSPVSVPAAVTAAIAARYPKAVVTKREKLTKGSVVSYEVQVKGARMAEVALAPDGTWISPKAAK